MLRLRDFDAELHGWVVVMPPNAATTYATIIGAVWRDKRGRFPNGRTIRTSVVLTPVEQIQPGAIVQNMNTRYLMVGPEVQRN